MKNRPALLLWKNGRVEAYNIDGRMIFHRATFNAAFGALEHYDYLPVRKDTSWGAKIMAALASKSPSLVGVRI